MKKLLILLLFIPLVFACSSSGDNSETSYTLRLTENYDRIAFQQVQLPGYNFEMDGQTDMIFNLNQGMPNGTADVKVTLTYYCTVNGVIVNRDVYVNFFENLTTLINVESVITCGIVTTVTILN